MNYNLKEAYEIAYDRDMYTQLVCRAVAWSHQADWWRKCRLKEETARPEACGQPWKVVAGFQFHLTKTESFTRQLALWSNER